MSQNEAVAVANRRSGLALRAAGRRSRGVNTAPWPGPGNSEGPVDPEGWAERSEEAYRGALADADRDGRADGPLPLTTDPWPGPGDSEGERP
jgi:hypothetical protein